jgi:hypothetical protein
MEHQMRARVVCVAGISAAALAASGLSVGVANASGPVTALAVASAHSTTGASGTHTSSSPTGVCGTGLGTYIQNGITSQDGAPTNPSLNTWGAKQVKSSSGGCSVKKIVVAGYPNQAMNIAFNIEVYKTTKKYDTLRYKGDPQPDDSKDAICSYEAKDGAFASAGDYNTWTIKLGKKNKCKISDKLAKKGVWFAIQADLDQAFGQWFWALQDTADAPNEADWRDTQNLFGTGCISFAKPPAGSDVGANRDLMDCIGYGPDLMLELL